MSEIVGKRHKACETCREFVSADEIGKTVLMAMQERESSNVLVLYQAVVNVQATIYHVFTRHKRPWEDLRNADMRNQKLKLLRNLHIGTRIATNLERAH